MKKSELIDAIASEAQITKTDARKALDAFLNATSNALKSGDKVTLVGFGTFSTVKKAARKGLNPSTKKPITIPAKRVAKFKPGSELRELVDKK